MPNHQQNKQIFVINDESAMTLLAQRLAQTAHAGDCFALHGELGAGKSFLARAMMRAWGVTDEALPSPTFAIIQEYEAEHGLKIAHMDWYRLHDRDDVEALGIYEYFEPPWITLIEWSSLAPEILPENAMSIDISTHPTHHNQRTVEIISSAHL